MVDDAFKGCTIISSFMIVVDSLTSLCKMRCSTPCTGEKL